MKLKRTIIIISITLFIINTSCKKDFTTIGNNLIEQPDFVGKTYDQAQVTIYDQAVEKVFSTNLPLHAIGVYNNDAFGVLKAEFVTTLLPDLLKFTPEGFGNNTKILTAEIRIPYFNREKTENGSKTFETDSIFGSEPMEIKVHEINYLLPSYDPNMNLESLRKYYSDFDFSPYFINTIADTIGFVPDLTPFVEYEFENDGSIKLDDNGDPKVKDTVGPQLIIKLDTTFIRQKILDKSKQDELLSTPAFKDYFRGIYFEIIPQNNNGSFIMPDFSKARIFIRYTHDVNNDNGTPNDFTDDFFEPKYEDIKLKFDTTQVNIYQNILKPDMQNALNNSDMINGDENVYIKGDAASQAVVHLFGEQEILDIKNQGWMINKAELYFYVDNTPPGSDDLLPQNLFLYDKTHHKPLIDFFDDQNINLQNKIFDGKLKTDDDGNKYYKFNITEHIRNIIEKDSLNVDLGLRVVTNPLIYAQSTEFKDPDNHNPKGVILFGNQTSVITKKPKLVIKYTKPEQ